MPARLIEEALEVWREGQRLLDDLPETAPEHEVVERAVESLRLAYQRLSAGDSPSANPESHSLAVQRAEDLIRSVRGGLKSHA